MHGFKKSPPFWQRSPSYEAKVRFQITIARDVLPPPPPPPPLLPPPPSLPPPPPFPDMSAASIPVNNPSVTGKFYFQIAAFFSLKKKSLFWFSCLWVKFIRCLLLLKKVRNGYFFKRLNDMNQGEKAWMVWLWYTMLMRDDRCEWINLLQCGNFSVFSIASDAYSFTVNI